MEVALEAEERLCELFLVFNFGVELSEEESRGVAVEFVGRRKLEMLVSKDGRPWLLAVVVLLLSSIISLGPSNRKRCGKAIQSKRRTKQPNQRQTKTAEKIEGQEGGGGGAEEIFISHGS